MIYLENGYVPPANSTLNRILPPGVLLISLLDSC
jgi:hypothetical protein